MNLRHVSPDPLQSVALALTALLFTAMLVQVNKVSRLPPSVFVACWEVIAGFVLVGLQQVLIRLLAGRRWANRVGAALLVVVAALALVKVTATGLGRHDEIYSWGLWAVQHQQGLPHDLYYTGSDYPQLFAYQLASVFLAQDNALSHFWVRLSCAFPLLLVLIVLGDALVKVTSPRLAWGFVLLIVALLTKFSSILLWAYADPLASACMAASLALLLVHERKSNWTCLTWAAVCALGAALAKQPGMVWALAAFPLYVLHGVWRRGWPWQRALPALAIALLALVWPLYLSAPFVNNSGVLDIAQKNGGLLGTLALSTRKYLIGSPSIALIVGCSLWVAWRNPRVRALWALFVLPQLVIWFVLGSYEARHGLHVVLACLLLAAFGWSEGLPDAAVARYPLAWVLAAAVLVVGVGVSYHRHHARLSDGARSVFMAQFGPGSERIFDALVGEQARMYLTSNYNYGVFYDRVPLHRPKHGDATSKLAGLHMALIESGATHTIDAKAWGYGVHAKLLSQLVQLCPQAFEPVLVSPVPPHMVLYSIEAEQLREAACTGRVTAATAP